MRHTEVRVGTAVAIGPPWAWARQRAVPGPGPVAWLQAQEGSVGSVDMPKCG